MLVIFFVMHAGYIHCWLQNARRSWFKAYASWTKPRMAVCVCVWMRPLAYPKIMVRYDSYVQTDQSVFLTNSGVSAGEFVTGSGVSAGESVGHALERVWGCSFVWWSPELEGLVSSRMCAQSLDWRSPSSSLAPACMSLRLCKSSSDPTWRWMRWA